MISFASQMTYEEFLNQSHQLSKIESYPQLTTRAEKIGFRITKVVYRGYQASSALQVCVYVCVCVCSVHSTVLWVCMQIIRFLVLMVVVT